MSNQKRAYFGKTSKLLCPDCGTVQYVSTYNDNTAQLTCGHSRSSALLPARGVTLENILAHDELAAKWFPPIKETWRYKTQKLMDEADMTAAREKWSFNNE